MVFGSFSGRSFRRPPKERGRIEVAGALPGEPDGVRAGEALLVQAASEGAEMDLVEPSEPRQEVLRLHGCHGELHFCSIFLFISSSPFSMISIGTIEQHGGCGFVECYDDPLPKFLSDLIGDLRDEVRRLRGEGSVVVFEDPTAVVALPAAQRGREVVAMYLEDQLEEKNAGIDALKGKYQNVVLLFLVFVVGLVAGKMLLQ